jgi:hypothetical protein
MKCDTHKTLLEICGSAERVRSQLLQAAACVSDRNATKKWADSLRFLTPRREYDATGGIISHHSDDGGVIPGHGIVPDINLDGYDDPYSKAHTNEIVERMDRRGCQCQRLTTRPFDFSDAVGKIKFDLVTVPRCTHYTAISYNWRKVAIGLDGEQAESCIRLEDGSTRPARTPADTLRRAIYHAATMADHLIWIDQDCIDQEDESDKELGIQAMDVVYQRAENVVALLNHTIHDDHQMEILAKWTSFVDVGEDFEPTSANVEEEARMLSTVLEGIISDRWFSRAWCAHERLSARDMQLSLGYAQKRRNADGSLSSFRMGEPASSVNGWSHNSLSATLKADSWPPGEAIFDPLRLAKNVEKGSEDMPEEFQRPLLRSALQLRKIWGPTGSVDTARHNIGRALRYYQDLSCTFDADKLAMLGNVCQYSTQINTRKADSSNISFSICVVALALLNGDESLICEDSEHFVQPDHGQDLSRRDPLEVVAKKWASSWIPHPTMKLDDVLCLQDRREASMLSLTRRGLDLQGWVWLMTDFIDLKSLQDEFSKPLRECPHLPGDLDDSGSGLEYSVKRSFWWTFLRLLTRIGHEVIAETIWQVLRPEILRNDRDQETLELPSNQLSGILDFKTGVFIPPTYISPSGEKRALVDEETFGLLGSGYMDLLDWIRVTVLTKGGIWAGVRANRGSGPRTVLSDGHADQQGPFVVLSHHVKPYTSAHEARIVAAYGQEESKSAWCRKVSRTRPLSWEVSANEENQTYALTAPCNCIFDHHGTPPSPLCLAWPEEYGGDDGSSSIADLQSFIPTRDADGASSTYLQTASTPHPEYSWIDQRKAAETLAPHQGLSFRDILSLSTPAERISAFNTARQASYMTDSQRLSHWLVKTMENYPEHRSVLLPSSSDELAYSAESVRPRHRWPEQLPTVKNPVEVLSSLSHGSSELQRSLTEKRKSLRSSVSGMKGKAGDKTGALWEKTKTKTKNPFRKGKE